MKKTKKMFAVEIEEDASKIYPYDLYIVLFQTVCRLHLNWLRRVISLKQKFPSTFCGGSGRFQIKFRDYSHGMYGAGLLPSESVVFIARPRKG